MARNRAAARDRRKVAAKLEFEAAIRARKQSTAKAFEESVKDNLADRVIDNFVGGLAELPFENRFAFCLTLLRGNDEDPATVVEDLAEKIHEATGTSRTWQDLPDESKGLRMKQAAGLFDLAAITK